jgi:hypothetical protein
LVKASKNVANFPCQPVFARSDAVRDVHVFASLRKLLVRVGMVIALG